MPQLRYITPHGVTVARTASKVPYSRGLSQVLKQLDAKRGAYFSSGYEYPERYSRWDVATVSPLLEIVGRGRSLSLNSLNERGTVLTRLLKPLLSGHSHWEAPEDHAHGLLINLKPLAERFPEEERSKQPSPFSLLRTLSRRIPPS